MLHDLRESYRHEIPRGRHDIPSLLMLAVMAFVALMLSCALIFVAVKFGPISSGTDLSQFYSP
jgi:hypothetical protein